MESLNLTIQDMVHNKQDSIKSMVQQALKGTHQQALQDAVNIGVTQAINEAIDAAINEAIKDKLAAIFQDSVANSTTAVENHENHLITPPDAQVVSIFSQVNRDAQPLLVSSGTGTAGSPTLNSIESSHVGCSSKSREGNTQVNTLTKSLGKDCISREASKKDGQPTISADGSATDSTKTEAEAEVEDNESAIPAQSSRKVCMEHAAAIKHKQPTTSIASSGTDNINNNLEAELKEREHDTPAKSKNRTKTRAGTNRIAIMHEVPMDSPSQVPVTLESGEDIDQHTTTTESSSEHSAEIDIDRASISWELPIRQLSSQQQKTRHDQQDNATWKGKAVEKTTHENERVEAQPETIPTSKTPLDKKSNSQGLRHQRLEARIRARYLEVAERVAAFERDHPEKAARCTGFGQLKLTAQEKASEVQDLKKLSEEEMAGKELAKGTEQHGIKSSRWASRPDTEGPAEVSQDTSARKELDTTTEQQYGIGSSRWAN